MYARPKWFLKVYVVFQSRFARSWIPSTGEKVTRLDSKPKPRSYPIRAMYEIEAFPKQKQHPSKEGVLLVVDGSYAGFAERQTDFDKVYCVFHLPLFGKEAT